MKFNSQICTSREQSERLLALGLKKETADMWYPHFARTCPIPLVDETLASDDIPAWSLARLVEMIPTYVGGDLECQITRGDVSYRLWNEKRGRSEVQKIFAKENFYDAIIDCIEWLIKEGYFKEYLV